MRPLKFLMLFACSQNRPIVTAPTKTNASPVARYPIFIASIPASRIVVEDDSRALGRRSASEIMAALQHVNWGD